MRNFKKLSILFQVVILFELFMGGCASIVSKSVYPVSVSAHPPETKVVITNSAGATIYEGNTPANIELAAGKAFFKREHYQAKFSREGYEDKVIPIHFKIDGWYWGNILLGPIGLLIIDPATGAMYKPTTESINETLVKSTASLKKVELKIYGINDIPSDLKKHLIPLK